MLFSESKREERKIDPSVEKDVLLNIDLRDEFDEDYRGMWNIFMVKKEWYSTLGAKEQMKKLFGSFVVMEYQNNPRDFQSPFKNPVAGIEDIFNKYYLLGIVVGTTKKHLSFIGMGMANDKKNEKYYIDLVSFRIIDMSFDYGNLDINSEIALADYRKNLLGLQEDSAIKKKKITKTMAKRHLEMHAFALKATRGEDND